MIVLFYSVNGFTSFLGDYYNRVLLNASTLHCPICIEVFAGTPLLLLCGHSFCQTCLRRLAVAEFSRQSNIRRQPTSIECPLCRRVTYVDESDDSKSIPKNYILETILDDVHAVSTEQEPFVVLDETLRFENKRLNALLKEKEREIEKLKKSLESQMYYTILFQVIAAVLGVGVIKYVWFSENLIG